METGKPGDIIKLLVPRIPRILKTAAFHSLSLAETSGKWNLRTALTVDLIRSLLTGKPQPFTEAQKGSIHDPGVKGPMWVSAVTFPEPEDSNPLEVVDKAFKAAGDGTETYTGPSILPVEGEWIGYRSGVGAKEPNPDVTAQQRYDALLKETKNELVVLYIHGGAFVYMDPCTHRVPAAEIAKLTGGRCFLPRYRLAPQAPFPAALLDCLIAYLSLLYPPPGSVHSAVPASKIVFSGDSAGGNLALSLVLLILILQGESSIGSARVRWYGKEVDLPLPLGAAPISPFVDVTRSFASEEVNAKWDYLPPPSQMPKDRPPCPLWPTNPPRQNPYCDDAALRHPLVSPVIAKSWKGCPPIFMITGEECLTDSNLFLAQKMVTDGVTVVLEQYMTMPHVFMAMLATLAESERAFKSYSDFTQNLLEKPASITTSGVRIEPVSLKETSLDIKTLSSISMEELARMMKDTVAKGDVEGLAMEPAISEA